MNQWEHDWGQAQENTSGLVTVLYVIGCVSDVFKFSLTNHKA